MSGWAALAACGSGPEAQPPPVFDPPGFFIEEASAGGFDVKPTSDVWSLAATFYAILTGQLPRDFPRDADPLAIVLGGSVVPILKRDARIPKPVAEVIDRALAFNPKGRYRDAEEMKMALTKALL